MLCRFYKHNVFDDFALNEANDTDTILDKQKIQVHKLHRVLIFQIWPVSGRSFPWMGHLPNKLDRHFICQKRSFLLHLTYCKFWSMLIINHFICGCYTSNMDFSHQRNVVGIPNVHSLSLSPSCLHKIWCAGLWSPMKDPVAFSHLSF